jgi:uncharacterized membrane protein YphA (DoxX/SURF4 family)
MSNVILLFIRIIIGLFFVIAGLDGFFSFLPPISMSDEAVTFTNALIDSNFLWQLMKATQLVAGILMSF